jgi:hypothetical protein
MQVAPTILKALGLDPDALDGVRLKARKSCPHCPSKFMQIQPGAGAIFQRPFFSLGRTKVKAV